MRIVWKHVQLPDFQATSEPTVIPPNIYEKRCQDAYSRAGCDWFIVYGDREHFANLTYLTRFDPRFEEAILILGPSGERILLVGNEGLGYTSQSGLALHYELCQSLSLMGQKREKAPRLIEVLRAVGIRSGQKVGLVGWKYLESEEANGELPGFFVPSILVDSLRLIVGDPAGVVDATHVLMHPINGLRSRNEAEQIAAFEWSAARATAAVWRIVCGVHPGMTEYEAVSQMGYEGDPLSAHVMFASGKDAIVGLRSPTNRAIVPGDGVSTAVSYWGGLGCRAGLIDKENEAFLSKIAIPYFRGVVTWYETVCVGISGDEIFSNVRTSLASGELRSALNPGHLMSLDEWLHTPVRPASSERIASGMAFQCDIIPEPLPPGWAINCEDPIVFADQNLRDELRQKYPHVWERIKRKQNFMRNVLGIQISDDILPLSSTPACLPPLWLAPDKLLLIE